MGGEGVMVVLLGFVLKGEGWDSRWWLLGSGELSRRPSLPALSLCFSHVPLFDQPLWTLTPVLGFWGSEIMPCIRDCCESKPSSWGLSLLAGGRGNPARHALPYCSCSRPQIGLLLSPLLLAFQWCCLMFLQCNYR